MGQAAGGREDLQEGWPEVQVSSSSTSSRLYLVTGDSVKSVSDSHNLSESHSCTSEEGRQLGLCFSAWVWRG